MARRVPKNLRQIYTRSNTGRPRPPLTTSSPISPKLIIYLILIIAALVGLSWVFRIERIVVGGTNNLDPVELERFVRQTLSRRLTGRNLISLDASWLRRELETAQPQINSARIVRHWPNQLIIQIEEKRTLMRWGSNNQVYLLDDQGVIVGPTSALYDSLPLITDQTNLPVKIGAKVVPPSFVSFCLEVYQDMEPVSGLRPQALTIPQTTSELHVQTNQRFRIKFDTNQSAQRQLEDLRLVMGELSKQRKNPAEYIDLRVSGKAYYR